MSTRRVQPKPIMEMGRNMHPTPLKQALQLMVLAVITCLVFDSQGLLDWSLKLPTGPIGDSIVWAVGQWHDFMDWIGATHVRQAFRDAFRYFQNL